MRSQAAASGGITALRNTALVTAGALAMATAACAGPRVGEIVGTPSSVTNTVRAKVVSATPVIGQVSVPRQVCYDETRQEAPRSSGAGALMGAIAGGAMGNAVGKGAGNALATGLGIIGGAVIGDHVENDGRPGTARLVRRCEQQPSYENRVVAYNVVYEFAGQRYNTQMASEPGPTIPLQVTLTPAVQTTSFPEQFGANNANPYDATDPDDDDGYAPRRYRHRRWD